jgi:CxxC motif-containing protein
MTEIKKVPCIICPVGCEITTTIEDGVVTSVTGNTCKRGDTYARAEVVQPVRTLTSVVKVETDGRVAPVSVRTEKPIPKALLFDAMKEVNKVKLKAPVHVGDTVIVNLLGTGIRLMATSNMK